MWLEVSGVRIATFVQYDQPFPDNQGDPLMHLVPVRWPDDLLPRVPLSACPLYD